MTHHLFVLDFKPHSIISKVSISIKNNNIGGDISSLRRGAGGMASFIQDKNLFILGGEEPAAL